MVVAGKRQHERNLHHLGRLEAQLAVTEPALGPAALHPDDDHQREHNERKDKERIGRAQPPANVGERDDEEQTEAEAIAHHVPARPRLERAARDRIKRGDADQGDGGDEGQERPVDQHELLLEEKLRPLHTLGEQSFHSGDSTAARAGAG